MLSEGKGEIIRSYLTHLKRHKRVRDETALVETQPQSILSRNKRIQIPGLDTEGEWI